MIPLDKLNHFIAGVVIYTLAQLVCDPLNALLVVALVAIAKECFDAVQNRKVTGHYMTGPHGVEALDVVATVAGGALVALPALTR